MDEYVQLRFEADQAFAVVNGHETPTHFRVLKVSSLTERKVAIEVVPHAMHGDPLLVKFERTSDLARQSLREQRISWCGPDGELFIFDPQLIVERPPRRSARKAALAQRPANYFSKRSSRVVRWLLNHPREESMVRSLASELELSEATVSRAVSSLARDRFVQTIEPGDDKREKRFRLRDGERLLEAWARLWESKHLETVSWDIGTLDAESTAELFSRESRTMAERIYPDERIRWCVGELSGAAVVNKTVEPSSMFVWVDRSQLDKWRHHLQPVEQTRRAGSGLLTIALTDDAYLFNAASPHIRSSESGWGAEVNIADPAQLYLDCRRAGERGLEAAEAVKETMELAKGRTT